MQAGDPFCTLEKPTESKILEEIRYRVGVYAVSHGGPIYVLISPKKFGELMEELPSPPTPEVGGRITMVLEGGGVRREADFVVIPGTWLDERHLGLYVVGDPGSEWLAKRPSS